MPELNGFETLEVLRYNGFNGHVIFTTAYDDYILKALRADALDYLLKPIDPDELNRAIQHYLDRTITKSETDFEKLKDKGLTKREVEIAKLIFQGLSSKEIGEALFISKGTVDKHRSNILQKTSCKNTTELFTLL